MKIMKWILAFYLLIFASVIALTAFVFGSILSAGMIRVAVDSHDSPLRLTIPFPAGLVDLGATMVGMVHVSGGCDFDSEIEPYQEMLEVAVEEFDNIPNGVTLVKVDGHEGRVRVRKANEEFEIDVRSRDGHVRVSVPARTVRKIMRAVV